MKAGAHFAVGGVAQTLSAWLADDVQLDPEQLVDQLTLLFGALTDPKLYGLKQTAAAATGSH
jgi:hypothetical protein